MASDQGNDAVYTGFWVDKDRGRVLGLTLTLQDKHAVPLVAALVILVTLAGGRSWHICRLMWHSNLRAKDSHTQAVREHRRNQQVLMRNSETAAGATMGLVEEWLFFGLTRVLRECSPKDILLGLFTVGHWAVFIVLGVLVSQVVIGKVVVSKALPTCGQWFPVQVVETGVSTEESNSIFNELQMNKSINSDNYVRSCYPQGGSEGRVDCNKFMLQSVQYKMVSDQTCPFNASACYPNAQSAVSLTSENITFSHLGLNTEYGNKISVQRRSNCAVMNINVFKTKEFDPAMNFSGTRTYVFFYDEERGKDFELVFSLRNQFSEDYKLVSLWLPFVKPENMASSIRPNTTTGHDVAIILLQGWGINFVKEQDDIWFRVHTELEYDGPVKEGFHRYRMDAFVNMIACEEQFRFCSSITSQCTPYQGLLVYESLSDIPSSYETLFGPDGLKHGSKKAWNFDLSVVLIENIMQQSALTFSIQGRGQSALQAARFLNGGEQERLLPEQWKFELGYWFMTALARLQIEILNTIDKPANVDSSRAENLWATKERNLLLNLCGRIKFRTSNYTSLSAFGLIMILVFSGVLLLGSTVGMLLLWLPWTRKWKSVAEWRRDEVLTLLGQTKRENSVDLQENYVDHTSVVIGDKSRPPGQQGQDQYDPFLMHG